MNHLKLTYTINAVKIETMQKQNHTSAVGSLPDSLKKYKHYPTPMCKLGASNNTFIEIHGNTFIQTDFTIMKCTKSRNKLLRCILQWLYHEYNNILFSIIFITNKIII